ncbi:hypothetical protein CAL7716_051180 [Calothrix sp. PCC 7716]|nr:hypothetical protein CAL7716_051180 [Calothrix sp. PCC 7716]
MQIANEKFQQATQFIKKLYYQYPNNLQINFELLECYQAFDRTQAITHGFNCLDITDNILDSEDVDFQDIARLVFGRLDVLRKLYKLLIKENRVDEARNTLTDFLSLINSIMENNPPPYRNEDTRVRMMSLAREGLIATFFLQGLREGRDMKKNLMDCSLMADDSPELTYHFDAKFSSADAEIMNILHSQLVF